MEFSASNQTYHRRQSTSIAEAKDPTTPPEHLRSLAQENSMHLRELIAGNPNCPLDLFRQLLSEHPEACRTSSAYPMLCLEEPLLAREVECALLRQLLIPTRHSDAWNFAFVASILRGRRTGHSARILYLTFHDTLIRPETAAKLDKLRVKKTGCRSRNRRQVAIDAAQAAFIEAWARIPIQSRNVPYVVMLDKFMLDFIPRVRALAHAKRYFRRLLAKAKKEIREARPGQESREAMVRYKYLAQQLPKWITG